MGRARGLWFATGCSGGSSFLYFFAVDVSGFGLGFGFFSPSQWQNKIVESRRKLRGSWFYK